MSEVGSEFFTQSSRAFTSGRAYNTIQSCVWWRPLPKGQRAHTFTTMILSTSRSPGGDTYSLVSQ